MQITACKLSDDNQGKEHTVAQGEENEAVPMHVCVVGLGYIGLPTAAFIAARGFRVTGVDKNRTYVNDINRGRVPFVEPGFEGLLANVISSGKLVAAENQVKADAYIVCVPTPFDKNHSLDKTFIEAAADEMAPYLSPGTLVVLESTSPPGTTRHLAEYLVSLRPDLSLNEDVENSLFVAHCPETVLPGRIMEEMKKNDRIIGGINRTSTERAVALYRTFVTAEIHETNDRTAELAKLTQNSFRDVNIAFANELSNICDRLDVDVWELISLANHHPRVNILQPGPGVGGHCIAVDPWFIVSSAPEDSHLIKTAREVNDDKPNRVLTKIAEAESRFEFPAIATFGITFKNDIDDIRESPALRIVQGVSTHFPQSEILVVEPNIDELPRELQNNNVRLVTTEEALVNAEIIVLLVSHKEFLDIDRTRLAGKQIIDTKGIWR